MPWDHCDVEFILDDERCPTCGLKKATWTLQIDKTRTFVLSVKKTKGPRASWNLHRARVGDVVGLLVGGHGLATGAQRTLRILEHDADGKHDPVEEVEATVGDDGLLSAEWRCKQVAHEDDADSRYELALNAQTWAEFFFEVDLAGGTIDSGQAADELFRPYGEIDEVFVDPAGNPLAGVPYRVVFANETERDGETDEDGRIFAQDCPPGAYRIELMCLPPMPLRLLTSSLEPPL